jgi:phosphoribosylanthranilate isomerase
LKRWVKVCGIRDRASAEAAIAGGASFVGLNFVAGRRRAVTLERAMELLPLFRGSSTIPVGVFLDDPIERIEELAARLGLTWLQLHGAEPPELVQRLAARWSVIKAIPVDERFDSQAALRPYRTSGAKAFLLDAPAPGSGRPFDWARLHGIDRSVAPFLVAGGLSAENVGRAIEVAAPDGVDTASGVELDGRPSPERVLEFCRAAKAAFSDGSPSGSGQEEYA